MIGMGEQSLVQQLSGSGLSETEAQAYLCVLEHGEATMTAIAEGADLSRRYSVRSGS